MKSNKVMIGIVIFLIVVLAGVLCYFFLIKKDEDNDTNDAKRFKEEYTEVADDNLFVYRDAEQIIKILEKGSGIVYLGFPECPWCQRYAKYLDEVAKENNIEKIYYFNIYEDRKNNTDNYKKIVSILEKYLDFDEEGNPRVFVPDVTFVKDGEIVAHDNETSLISEGTPEEYWTEDKVAALKEKLNNYIIDNQINLCTSCN